METVCIYLPSHLVRKLNEGARREARSRSNYVRQLLERSVAEPERPARDASRPKDSNDRPA